MGVILNELEHFNAQGTDAIQSCSEALLKTHGLINLWYANPRERCKIFYRGEVDYEWSLISKLGRQGYKHNPDNPFCVTQGELNALNLFQDRVYSDSSLREFIFERNKFPEKDDPQWWEIAQHYDTENGTRMLDLTTSIFSALYFACCDWNGNVDETKDGAIYLFPRKPGRCESKSSDFIDGGIKVEGTDLARETASTYFNIDTRADFARFREARGRNDRLIAQDGYFFWQPKFDFPMQSSQFFLQHFKFRVFRNAKAAILRELYSTGYTARRMVRGSIGEEAHLSICRKLDLDPDE